MEAIILFCMFGIPTEHFGNDSSEIDEQQKFRCPYEIEFKKSFFQKKTIIYCKFMTASIGMYNF